MTWVRSKQHIGLFVQRRGTDVAFTYDGASSVFSARAGERIHGTGTFPPEIANYVWAKVRELLPPHRRHLLDGAPNPIPMANASMANASMANASMANEMAAPTANQEAAKETPKEGLIAPIVGAPEPTVKENETMLDFTNPAAVKAASAIALKIKTAVGIQELEGRRADLLQVNRQVEVNYRQATAAKNEAKRQLDDADDAIKAREQELVIEAAAVLGEDGKKRFTTVDAQKAGAVALRKTDAEYLALIEARGKAAQAHYEAELAEANAKAEQRSLVREHDLLVADLALATARIEAFAGLDAEPTTTAA